MKSKFQFQIKPLGLMICFLITFSLGLFAVKSPDLGFHLNSAKIFSETGVFPQLDQQTFTREGLSHYPHSFLPALLFYHIYEMGGFPALIVVKSVIIALSFCFVFLTLFEVSGKGKTYYYLFLLLIAALCSRRRFLIQPFIFTDLFFTFTLWQLSRFQNYRTQKTLFWILLAFFFWFHAHLGVIFGLVVVFIFGVCLFIEKEKDRRHFSNDSFWKILLPSIFVLGIVSAFINPSSRNIWIHLFHELKNPGKQEHVMEYISGWIAMPEAMGLLTVFLIALILYQLFSRGKETLRERMQNLFVLMKSEKYYFFLFVIFAMGASLYQREIFHFSVCWVLVMGILLPEKWQIKPGSTTLLPSLLRWASLLFVFSVSGLNHPHYIPRLNLDPLVFPFSAFEYLSQSLKPKKSHKIFNTMLYGGWLQFYYGDQIKVFHDGRGPLYGPEFFQNKVFPLLKANERWPEIFYQYQIEGVIIDLNENLCSPLWKSKDWHAVYFDDQSVIFLPHKRVKQTGSLFFVRLNPCLSDKTLWKKMNQNPVFRDQVQTEIEEVVQSQEGNQKMMLQQNPRFLYLFGLIHLLKGDAQKGLETLQKNGALGLSRINNEGNIGRLACQLGKFNLAQENFRLGERFLGRSPEFWSDWQQCLSSEGRVFASWWIGLKGFLWPKFWVLG